MLRAVDFHFAAMDRGFEPMSEYASYEIISGEWINNNGGKMEPDLVVRGYHMLLDDQFLFYGSGEYVEGTLENIMPGLSERCTIPWSTRTEFGLEIVIINKDYSVVSEADAVYLSMCSKSPPSFGKIVGGSGRILSHAKMEGKLCFTPYYGSTNFRPLSEIYSPENSLSTPTFVHLLNVTMEISLSLRLKNRYQHRVSDSIKHMLFPGLSPNVYLTNATSFLRGRTDFVFLSPKPFSEGDAAVFKRAGIAL